MIRISEILMATVIVWMEEVDSFFGPEVIGGPFFMKRKVINYITQTAIFGGLAAILYCVPGLQFKIPFVAPGFMEIHLDEIPILISSFAYGPFLGIFEILLGSLLQISQESGKGQLIFTSHNLRPLEVLNDENIIFTTTNPKNRYINLKGIREDNNLRDTYIRALKLGGQDESLSTEFKESHIRIALRKAGKHGN